MSARLSGNWRFCTFADLIHEPTASPLNIFATSGRSRAIYLDKLEHDAVAHFNGLKMWIITQMFNYFANLALQFKMRGTLSTIYNVFYQSMQQVKDTHTFTKYY